MSASRRTLVILHPHFTLPGGAGRFVLEVASRLADRGFRVIVVCIRAEPELVAPYLGRLEVREIGGPLSSSFLFWLLFPRSVARTWKALPKEPIILFPQVFPANWWGFLHKLFHPRTPLVWMCHEPSAFIHSRKWLSALPSGPAAWGARICNPLLKPLDVWLARHVDRVFANSAATKRLACGIYGYDPGVVEVCHPGVDTRRFCPGDQARQDQVITVGRLTRFKNVDVIMRAIRALNEARAVPVVLKVVGGGEEEANLRQLASDLGLERQVVFCGSLGEEGLVTALQESKAFVLASEDEPFGIVAVEAMACGTPCVVEGRGGPAETVLDGQTGFHVDGPDPAAYAAKLRLLLDDPRLFAAMSRQAAQRAGQYSWEAAADRLAACFDDLPG